MCTQILNVSFICINLNYFSREIIGFINYYKSLSVSLKFLLAASLNFQSIKIPFFFFFFLFFGWDEPEE